MPIIAASLVVNVLVAGFFGLATGLSLNSIPPKLDVVFGPDTPSRRILACLYLAIAAVSAVALLAVPLRMGIVARRRAGAKQGPVYELRGNRRLRYWRVLLPCIRQLASAYHEYRQEVICRWCRRGSRLIRRISNGGKFVNQCSGTSRKCLVAF